MQRSHRITAWLLGLALVTAACSGDSSESPDTSTTLGEFTSIITAGPELTGSAQALANALTLAEAGRMTEAIAGFDDVIARFAGAGDLDSQRDVVDAYFNKALTQTATGDAAGAIETYAQMAAATPANPDLEVTETVSLGLVNRGNLLIELGRFEEAIATFDDVLNRFGARQEPEIQFTVIGAALGKGDALVNLGDIGQAVFVYDLVVVEAGTKAETAFEGMQVAALVSKGRALQRGGRLGEAVATLNFVLDAWIGNQDGTIASLVGLAQSARDDIAAQLSVPGEPGTCLFLEEGDCVLRDRFPPRPNVAAPFLPHIVAFNLEPGRPVYVPYDGIIEGIETVEGTAEQIIVFTIPPSEDAPESRCTLQFIPEGPIQVTEGPGTAGTLIGTVADDRLSGPAETGFIYNLTINCLFRDPLDDDRFGPDNALIDELFGELPPS